MCNHDQMKKEAEYKRNIFHCHHITKNSFTWHFSVKKITFKKDSVWHTLKWTYHCYSDLDPRNTIKWNLNHDSLIQWFELAICLNQYCSFSMFYIVTILDSLNLAVLATLYHLLFLVVMVYSSMFVGNRSLSLLCLRPSFAILGLIVF